MRVLGIILVIVAGIVWLGGSNLILAARRRRFGENPLVFNLSPIRFKAFTTSEKRWLLVLLLATCVIALLGLAALQSAFG